VESTDPLIDWNDATAIIHIEISMVEIVHVVKGAEGPPSDGRQCDTDMGRNERPRTPELQGAGMGGGPGDLAGDGTTIFAASRDGAVRRFRCDVCLPLEALESLISSRVTRELTPGGRAQYIP
jgi:hypothetical protein